MSKSGANTRSYFDESTDDQVVFVHTYVSNRLVDCLSTEGAPYRSVMGITYVHAIMNIVLAIMNIFKWPPGANFKFDICIENCPTSRS